MGFPQHDLRRVRLIMPILAIPDGQAADLAAVLPVPLARHRPYGTCHLQGVDPTDIAGLLDLGIDQRTRGSSPGMSGTARRPPIRDI